MKKDAAITRAVAYSALKGSSHRGIDHPHTEAGHFTVYSGEVSDRSLLLPHWGFTEPRFFS